MRRSDLGYRRLYSRCWEAHMRGDVAALRDLALDPSLSPDMVATIAPLASDVGDVELVRTVLEHPSCSTGVASRYATHPDPAIRGSVARFPGLPTSSLGVLAIDVDENVRAAAIAALTERAGTMTGD